MTKERNEMNQKEILPSAYVSQSVPNGTAVYCGKLKKSGEKNTMQRRMMFNLVFRTNSVRP